MTDEDRIQASVQQLVAIQQFFLATNCDMRHTTTAPNTQTTASTFHVKQPDPRRHGPAATTCRANALRIPPPEPRSPTNTTTHSDHPTTTTPSTPPKPTTGYLPTHPPSYIGMYMVLLGFTLLLGAGFLGLFCHSLGVWVSVCTHVYIGCRTFGVLSTLFTAFCDQPNVVRAVAQP